MPPPLLLHLNRPQFFSRSDHRLIPDFPAFPRYPDHVCKNIRSPHPGLRYKVRQLLYLLWQFLLYLMSVPFPTANCRCRFRLLPSLNNHRLLHDHPAYHLFFRRILQVCLSLQTIQSAFQLFFLSSFVLLITNFHNNFVSLYKTGEHL